MVYTSVARNLLIAPRKLRLIARPLRGRTVDEVDQVLRLYRQKAAKLLRRAVKTAVHNGRLSLESRLITLEVGEGMKLRRQFLFGRGIARPYFKQRSHLRLVFNEAVTSKPVTSHKLKQRDLKRPRISRTSD